MSAELDALVAACKACSADLKAAKTTRALASTLGAWAPTVSASPQPPVPQPTPSPATGTMSAQVWGWGNGYAAFGAGATRTDGSSVGDANGGVAHTGYRYANDTSGAQPPATCGARSQFQTAAQAFQVQPDGSCRLYLPTGARQAGDCKADAVQVFCYDPAVGIPPGGAPRSAEGEGAEIYSGRRWRFDAASAIGNGWHFIESYMPNAALWPGQDTFTYWRDSGPGGLACRVWADKVNEPGQEQTAAFQRTFTVLGTTGAHDYPDVKVPPLVFGADVYVLERIRFDRSAGILEVKAGTSLDALTLVYSTEDAGALIHVPRHPTILWNQANGAPFTGSNSRGLQRAARIYTGRTDAPRFHTTGPLVREVSWEALAARLTAPAL